VVVVHQPVAVPTPAEAHDLLHGHQAALRRWAAAGADLVVGGHIHLPYVLALPALRPSPPLWVVQAGTAISRRVRAGVGNSVNLIELQGRPARRGRVERWDHDPAAQRFECVAVHPLEPGGGT
jgi:hypothetical protein